VSKRRAAWPQWVRWLVGIAAVVVGLVIAWALFVPIADLIAHHDVGSVKGSLHETALDNARGRLLTLGAGLFAAGALVFTARNFTLSRRTFELTEQGQVTGRSTKAITQLGSKKLDVRIGGIYALEHIALDSPEDYHPTVMEVLAALIREHSRKPWSRPASDDSRAPGRLTRPDVQAALRVIGRRNVANDGWWHIDLTGAVLPGALLFHTNMTQVRLVDADLTRASLTGAILAKANLTGADLTGAIFSGADLTGAVLAGANLDRADFTPQTLPSRTRTPNPRTSPARTSPARTSSPRPSPSRTSPARNGLRACSLLGDGSTTMAS
jgi:hypothetical protein